MALAQESNSLLNRLYKSFFRQRPRTLTEGNIVKEDKIVLSSHKISRRELLLNFGVPVGILAGSLATAAFLSPIIPTPIAIPIAMGAGGWLRGKLRHDDNPMWEAGRWAGLGLVAQFLVSCAPTPTQEPKLITPSTASATKIIAPGSTAPVPSAVPTKERAYEDFTKTVKIHPEAAFFSVATRLASSENAIGLDTLVTDNVQKDSIMRALLANQIAAGKFADIQNEALRNGTAIGFSGCADSREIAPFAFPTTIQGTQATDVLKAKPGVALQVNMIGTQPARFQEGVNMSFFVTHSKCIGAFDGCGALGGVKAILGGGENSLLEHGVSPLTIKQLKEMIALGAEPDPEKWAKTGARLQAELNFKAHKVNHFVAYGVSGTADGSFTVKGVIDAFGNDFTIDKFPLLQQYADFFNKPHPILEKIAAGQAPKINLLNGSRTHSTAKLFGDMAQEQGIIFKVSTADLNKKKLTIEEVRKMIEGVEYSLTHLKQDGRVLMLVADTIDDMTLLRTTLLAEATGIDRFIAEGGIIVELLPNDKGRFSGMMTLRNKTNLKSEFNLLKGVFTNNISLDEGLLKEAQEIIFKQIKAGKISEQTGEKLMKILRFTKPIGSFMGRSLRGISDALVILDVKDVFYKDVLGLDSIWKLPSSSIKLDSDFVQPSMDDDVKYMRENPGVNPRLRNFEISFTQKQLADAYQGAVQAYMKWGPLSSNPAPPWNQMQPKDIGKMIQLTVPPVTNAPGANRSTFGSSEEIHHILILIQPETDFSTGGSQFNYSDPNQQMMLTDLATGAPIFGSLSNENNPRIVVSLSPNNPNLMYYWSVESIPSQKKFRMRYIYAKKKP